MEVMKVYHFWMKPINDLQGFGSKRATEKFLKEVDRFHPEVIHLHNLHGYYINIGPCHPANRINMQYPHILAIFLTSKQTSSFLSKNIQCRTDSGKVFRDAV